MWEKCSMELNEKELIETSFDNQFINRQLSLDKDVYLINAAKRKKKDEDEDDLDEEDDDDLVEEEENPFDIEPTEEDIIEDEFPDDDDDLFEEDEDSFR